MDKMNRMRRKENVRIKRKFIVYDSKNKEIFNAKNVECIACYLKTSKNKIYSILNKDKSIFFDEINDYVTVTHERIKIIHTPEKPFFLPKKSIINIIDLPGEKWKTIPGVNECNMVSNMGRFKYVDSEGNETFGTLTKSKNKTGKYYRDASVKMSYKNTMKVRFHRLIAKTFLDESLGLLYKDDKRVVDHIDGNSENDLLDNLQILKNNGENIRKAIYEEGKNVWRNRTDVELRKKNKCMRFNSMNNAARYLNINIGSISQAARKGYKAKDWTVRMV